MAEAFLNTLGGEFFEAESAGLEPGKLNPNVVQVMMDAGIDISQNTTKSVFELFTQGRKYDAVITVCDGANAERCPVFPGLVKRINWSFADPSSFTGTRNEILAKTAEVRDTIKEQVQQFIETAKDYEFWAK
jgi:arsenate reductase